MVARHSDPNAGAYTCIGLHPDGIIVGTGLSDGAVRAWDIVQGAPLTLLERHGGAVTSMSFSENGYVLATGGEDGVVKLWDLRGPSEITSIAAEAGAIRAVAFDLSRSYLAAVGDDVRVYAQKTWHKLLEVSGHAKDATAVAWSPDAHFLVTTGMDRALKVYSAAS